jgi:hypothetical protein
MGRMAGRFVRVEPRRRARAFVLGLLSDLPCKNCWTVAEQAGDANPYGPQHLLLRAKWDAVAVTRNGPRVPPFRFRHWKDAKSGVSCPIRRRSATP